MSSLILVDDHALFRSGLKMILSSESGFEIVGEAACGKEAIDLVASMKGKADLVLLDINLPDMDGIEVARAIRDSGSDIKILVITMYEDAAFLKAALDAGVDGYVIKQAIDSELITAVRSVLNGNNYVYPTLAPLLYQSSKKSHVESESEEVVLSSREKDVLRFLALGYTQREIGDALHISEKTVETYKSRLFVKLGITKRSELVRYAFERGLVEI